MSFDLSTAAGQVTVSLLAFCGLVLLSALIRGFSRRTGRALLRLVSVAGAAVVSALTLHSALQSIATYDLSATLSSVPGMPENVTATLTQLQTTMPGVYQLVASIPMALLLPLLFIFFFFVFSLLFGIPYLILAVILFPKHRKSPILFSRLWGTLIGAVQGVLVCAVYLIPLTGYALFGGTVVQGVKNATADNETVQSVAQTAQSYTDAMAQNKISATLYRTLQGEKLFDYLTSFTYTDESGTVYEVRMTKEVDVYADILRDALPLAGKQPKEYTTAEADAIRAVAEDLRSSDSLTIALSGVLSEMCKAWNANEPFFGIEKPNTGDEKTERLLDAALDLFEDSTPATLSDDMVALADTIAVMTEHDFFAAMEDPALLAEKIKDEQFIDDLMAAMEKSDNLKELMHETVKVGVQVVCEEYVSKTGGAEAYNDTITAISDNVATKLNGLTGTDEEKKDALAAEMKAALTESGVSDEDVPDAVLGYVSQFILDEFAENETVTAEDIMNYFGFSMMSEDETVPEVAPEA